MTRLQLGERRCCAFAAFTSTATRAIRAYHALLISSKSKYAVRLSLLSHVPCAFLPIMHLFLCLLFANSCVDAFVCRETMRGAVDRLNAWREMNDDGIHCVSRQFFSLALFLFFAVLRRCLLE